MYTKRKVHNWHPPALSALRTRRGRSDVDAQAELCLRELAVCATESLCIHFAVSLIYRRPELMMPVSLAISDNRSLSRHNDDSASTVRSALSPRPWHTVSQSHLQRHCSTIPLYGAQNKKLSCRRETAQCFISLNILLSHSRSLKVILNGPWVGRV